MTTHVKHRSTASAEPAVTSWAPAPVIERPAWKALKAHHAKRGPDSSTNGLIRRYRRLREA